MTLFSFSIVFSRMCIFFFCTIAIISRHFLFFFQFDYIDFMIFLLILKFRNCWKNIIFFEQRLIKSFFHFFRCNVLIVSFFTFTWCFVLFFCFFIFIYFVVLNSLLFDFFLRNWQKNVFLINQTWKIHALKSEKINDDFDDHRKIKKKSYSWYVKVWKKMITRNKASCQKKKFWMFCQKLH